MTKPINEFEKLAIKKKVSINKNPDGSYISDYTRATYAGWLMFQEHALTELKKIVEKS